MTGWVKMRQCCRLDVFTTFKRIIDLLMRLWLAPEWNRLFRVNKSFEIIPTDIWTQYVGFRKIDVTSYFLSLRFTSSSKVPWLARIALPRPRYFVQPEFRAHDGSSNMWVHDSIVVRSSRQRSNRHHTFGGRWVVVRWTVWQGEGPLQLSFASDFSKWA